MPMSSGTLNARVFIALGLFIIYVTQGPVAIEGAM